MLIGSRITSDIMTDSAAGDSLKKLPLVFVVQKVTILIATSYLIYYIIILYILIN